VLSLDRLELWVEYATNYHTDFPGVWYTNHVYTQGYTYNGRIIGHYMGADASDLFLKGRYSFDAATFTVSYEKLKKYLPTVFIWEDYAASLETELFPSAKLKITAEYAREETAKVVAGVGFNYQF
jgi:hypothetical protein